jgi:hypothetical protein
MTKVYRIITAISISSDENYQNIQHWYSLRHNSNFGINISLSNRSEVSKRVVTESDEG